MKSEASYHLRRQVMWGLVLVGLGVVFLLDQMDIYPARNLWHYAPLLMVVAGINQTIGYPSGREFANGLWTVCVGLWFFALLEGLWGITIRNSWPLFIIFSGIAMAIRPIAERRFNNQQRQQQQGGDGHGQ